MADRCGGRVGAVRYWLKQVNESPCVPTFPVDQGWVPAHSMVS